MGRGLSIARHVLRSLVLTALTTIVAYIVQEALAGKWPPTSSHFYDSMLGNSKHDAAIMDCLVQDATVGISSIGGLRKLKEELHTRVVLPLTYPKVFFERNELTPPRTLLFHGPPGTGKTMLARALAHESKVPFFCITLSTLEDKYFGETPKLIRSAFKVARERAPCILFFDEIDGLMRHRRDDDQSSVYGAKTEVLQCMDTILRERVPVTVIACTNHFSALDAAMVRRFGAKYEITAPTFDDRLCILLTLTEGETTRDHDVLEYVARKTCGMTGSNLKDLYESACSRRLQSVLQSVTITSQTCSDDVMKHIGGLALSDWLPETSVSAATEPSVELPPEDPTPEPTSEPTLVQSVDSPMDPETETALAAPRQPPPRKRKARKAQQGSGSDVETLPP